MSVFAVQIMRKMRGGSQSLLILGADGQLYVVKFRNNPQGERTLVNEMIATRIAATIGLTVAEPAVVEVSDWLIERSPDTWMEKLGQRYRCAPGLHFGSRFVGGLMPGQVVDYLPVEMLSSVRNVEEFAGILCVDQLTCNADGRQAVFSRKEFESRYTATFIDQGFCFYSNEWKFFDNASRGVYRSNEVYQGVTGWDSLEPWLSRVEALEPHTLVKIARDAPPEWYGGQASQLQQLIEELWVRRTKVRDLIGALRDSNRKPFPNWKRVAQAAVPELPPGDVGPPVLRHTCLA